MLSSNKKRKQSDCKEETQKEAKRKKTCSKVECGFLSYGKKGGIKERCREHKEWDDVNLYQKICERAECLKEATFGKTSKKKQWCNAHKGVDDVCLSKKILCQHEGCLTMATFGKTDKKKEWCKQHKGAGDIQLMAKRCKYSGCNTQPSFGKINGSPVYCLKHKEPGDTNVCNRFCQHPGCGLLPGYGKPGKKATHCATHKEKGEQPRSAPCAFLGCNTRPSYGILGGPRIHCTKHKLPGEEILNARICSDPECKKQASFGAPGTKNPAHCLVHKEDGEVNIVGRFCKFPGCGKHAAWGFHGKDPLHCATHKEKHEYSLKDKECSVVGCDRRVFPYHAKLTDEMCVRCCPWYRPTRVRKMESLCCSFLEEQLRLHYPGNPHLQIHQANRSLSKVMNSTKKYCPDYWLTSHHPGGVCTTIVVEIDEHGHLSSYGYNPVADKIRTEEIASACNKSPPNPFGGCKCLIRKTVFIRMNPNNTRRCTLPLEEKVVILWKEVDAVIKDLNEEWKNDKMRCIRLFF